MKLKLIIGTTILFISTLFSLTYLSKSEANAPQNIVLSSKNLIVLNQEINGESTSAVISKVKELDSNMNSVKERVSGKAPLYLFIYSPGGSIQSGLEMIEALKGIGRPVNTITLFSASMAFQLTQNLGDRLVLENGILMSHHAAGEVEGAFGGLPTQFDSRYQFWLQRIKELDMQTVKRTNGKQTYESYTKQYDHEMWLTGTQAVSQGYSDKVVTAKCDSSLTGVTNHMAQFFGMVISYDLDNCPLNTTPMNIRATNFDGKTLLTAEQLDKIKTEFLAQYESKARAVIPMKW